MNDTTTAATDDQPWLQAVADVLDQSIWTWDVGSDRLVFANAAFRRHFGHLVGRGTAGSAVMLEHVHPDDRERLRAARARLPATGYVEVYRLVHPATATTQARVARLQERAVPMRGPHGDRQVTHVLRDVTWQMETTAQLHAEISRRTDAERLRDHANARLQALIAGANDAVVSIGADGRVVDWNQAAERMFGWSRDEAQGRDLAELILPEAHRAAHTAGIARYLRDGTRRLIGRRVEAYALRRGGDAFEVELSIWPVQSEGQLTFSAFVRDISRRKSAEKALAESEAKYRKVVENVSEGILVGAGGRILYANPKALELTGIDEQAALSRPFIDFLHPDDRERVVENHTRRLRGEPIDHRYQFRVITTAGETRWIEISGVVIEWQGAPATLNFLSDVTSRRLAEEELRSALAKEREVSELKSRFVAVASHEFRTPLAAILSSIELLDDYGPRLPETERREVVGLVKGAVARMNGMIEQVLLTSRLEAGQFTFDPQPHAVAQLLVQVAAELEQAHPQAARVQMRCENLDLPRQVDARLLRHVLMNLLSNALKYSQPDTEVRCTLAGEGDQLRLEIADRGIGIPAADLPRLFERFHRGGNVGNIQGTGIGLHVVRDCVQLHGGFIDVDSEPGRGTTFRVRLHAPLVHAA